MALFELTKHGLNEVDRTTLAAERIFERGDLQRILRDKISIVAPGTMVLAEEFGDFDQSKRRIDLLCLDQDANLVVVELKRTEDGGHMDLQAIRYAAMVSTMTFEQAVRAHRSYLSSVGSEVDAEAAILAHLDWEGAVEHEFASEVKIVLVSADFSKEVTTSVLWLNERDLDVRCVRLHPYKTDDRLLLDIQQVIPLPEAEEYQVRVREKERQERTARKSSRDYTKFDVSLDGRKLERLPKRQAVFEIVRHLWCKGVFEDDLAAAIPWKKRTRLFHEVNGEHDVQSFEIAANAAAESNGRKFDSHRWFCRDGELLVRNAQTCALTNQWDGSAIDALNDLVRSFPDAGIEFEVHEPEL